MALSGSPDPLLSHRAHLRTPARAPRRNHSFGRQACVSQYQAQQDGAAQTHVTFVKKQEAQAGGKCKLDLVLCTGMKCAMVKFTVNADGTDVQEGWGPAANATAGAGSGAASIATCVLETKQGVKVQAADVLQGKIVALYFSAHWCT